MQGILNRKRLALKKYGCGSLKEELKNFQNVYKNVGLACLMTSLLSSSTICFTIRHLRIRRSEFLRLGAGAGIINIVRIRENKYIDIQQSPLKLNVFFTLHT